MKQSLGFIGLGKMGFGMVELLLEKGHTVSAFNRSKEAMDRIKEKGALIGGSISEVVGTLPTPRVVWLMVPSQAVSSLIDELIPILEAGDTVIDGGNTHYIQTLKHDELLQSKGISFLDVGVSGGPRGAREGACLMIGGGKEQFEANEDLFRDLSAPGAYSYMGKAGAGHFTKMVHNGIEYGMMQSIAEGFSILKKSDFDISLHEATRIYGNQSVISSRLIDWLQSGMKEYGEDLDSFTGVVEGTGEGAWTVEAGKTLGVETPIIEASVLFREQSKSKPSYTGKVIAVLRNQFGGHRAT